MFFILTFIPPPSNCSIEYTRNSEFWWHILSISLFFLSNIMHVIIVALVASSGDYPF